MLMARCASTAQVMCGNASIISAVYCSRYFISKGASVDKVGGDLKSTPLHWATRYISVS